MEVSVDTNVRRRRNLDVYDSAGYEEIELLLAPGLAAIAERVDLSMSQFLWFHNLKAMITLPDGMTLGRRASPV